MADLELTALDGGRVVASGSGVPPTAAGCTSFAVLTIGRRLQEFTAGDARFSQVQAAHMTVAAKARYSMRGGQVLLSTKEDTFPEGSVLSYMHVAWEGRNHSLSTVMYHGDTDEALALLDVANIQEDANGIVLAPTDARVSILQDSQHAPGVVVPVPGQGLLQTAKVSRYWDTKRPAWAGMPARGGQLYVEKHGHADHVHPDMTVLMFGRTAVTRIHLNARDNELASSATDLVVDWT